MRSTACYGALPAGHLALAASFISAAHDYLWTFDLLDVTSSGSQRHWEPAHGCMSMCSKTFWAMRSASAHQGDDSEDEEEPDTSQVAKLASRAPTSRQAHRRGIIVSDDDNDNDEDEGDMGAGTLPSAPPMHRLRIVCMLWLLRVDSPTWRPFGVAAMWDDVPLAGSNTTQFRCGMTETSKPRLSIVHMDRSLETCDSVDSVCL